jgi:hypothetical protein
LLPVIQISFLLGNDIQEISGCTVRLFVVTEQVKGTLDVRHLFCIKAWFVIILCQTDNAVYCLAEDVACFEQQETETADNVVLPRNPIFEPRGFLRMRSLPAVEFRQVLGFQFHPFTVMVVLHGLDFTLQPLNGFLMRGYDSK